MATPAFTPGTYALGYQCTYAGQVWEKLTKTSKVTAAPKAGATWKLVEVAAPDAAVRKMGPIDLRTLGLLPGADTPLIAAQNALLMDKIIKENPYAHFVASRPGSYKTPYVFDRVPGSGVGAPDGIDYAITFRDPQQMLECERGVVLETKPGVPGIQWFRTTDYCDLHLINVKLHHQGGADWGGHGIVGHDEKGAPIYGEDWGNDYKLHGLAARGVFTMRGIEVSGFPGHGLSMWGSTQSFANGRQIALPKQSKFELGGQGDLVLNAGDAGFVSTVGVGMKVVVEGVEYTVGGTWGPLLSLGYTYDRAVLGKAVSGYMYAHGFSLFTDHCVADGRNEFKQNGGGGVHTVGNECNANALYNISCVDNMAPGFIMQSFLGDRYFAPHANNNSRRFQGKYGNYWVSAGGNPNNDLLGAIDLFGPYDEGGAVPPWLESRTGVFGGTLANGYNGGYGIVAGRMERLISAGPDQWMQFDKGQIIMNSNHGAPSRAIRFVDTPNGVNIGW